MAFIFRFNPFHIWDVSSFKVLAQTSHPVRDCSACLAPLPEWDLGGPTGFEVVLETFRSPSLQFNLLPGLLCWSGFSFGFFGLERLVLIFYRCLSILAFTYWLCTGLQ